jgi:hypothetical protein
MNKFKTLLLTAVAAATMGTGALAVSPSASAEPNLGPLPKGCVLGHFGQYTFVICPP